MQQSEAFRRDLQAIFRERVLESFSRAHLCLTFARMARQSGDQEGFHRMIQCTRVLRMAAAGWRRRAQAITPVLLTCLVWLAGCAIDPAVRVTDAVSLPSTLVADACEEGHTREPLLAFEHAEVIIYNGDAWGLDCDLYDFGIADHRRRLVDFRRSTYAVKRILDYLTANDIPVPRDTT